MLVVVAVICRSVSPGCVSLCRNLVGLWSRGYAFCPFLSFPFIRRDLSTTQARNGLGEQKPMLTRLSPIRAWQVSIPWGGRSASPRLYRWRFHRQRVARAGSTTRLPYKVKAHHTATRGGVCWLLPSIRRQKNQSHAPSGRWGRLGLG